MAFRKMEKKFIPEKIIYRSKNANKRIKLSNGRYIEIGYYVLTEKNKIYKIDRFYCAYVTSLTNGLKTKGLPEVLHGFIKEYRQFKRKV